MLAFRVRVVALLTEVSSTAVIGQATKDDRLFLKGRWRSFYEPHRVKLFIKSVGTKRLLREAVEKSRTAATQNGY
jgi:hypothetical protein